MLNHIISVTIQSTLSLLQLCYSHFIELFSGVIGVFYIRTALLDITHYTELYRFAPQIVSAILLFVKAMIGGFGGVAVKEIWFVVKKIARSFSNKIKNKSEL